MSGSVPVPFLSFFTKIIIINCQLKLACLVSLLFPFIVKMRKMEREGILLGAPKTNFLCKRKKKRNNITNCISYKERERTSNTVWHSHYNGTCSSQKEKNVKDKLN